jgi:RNA polymerase sigma factor (sigma-70 family)
MRQLFSGHYRESTRNQISGTTMPTRFPKEFWQRVTGWLGSQPLHGCDDAQLLERFVTTRDEAAFQTLLERHGPMVWSVCQRTLRHVADAEDAFQATFLVLLRRAEAIRKSGSVGSWLQGVALRTAQKARVQAARRHVREISTATVEIPGPEAATSTPDPVLEEELARLPDKYRLPLVLCYYQGQTLEHAAQSLGWPLGTVAGRMSRAREQLRKRLQRRGVMLTVAAVAATLAARTATAVSPALGQQTLQTCLAWLTPGKTVPAPIQSLVQGVLRAMFWSKMKLVGIVLLALGLLGLSGGLLWSYGGTQAGADPQLPGSGKGLGPSGQGTQPQRSLASKLAEDEVAYGIRLKQTEDLFQPGDRVDVLVVRKVEQPQAELLLQNLEILAINTFLGQGGEQPITVVVRLKRQDAPKLVAATETGKIDLVLRSKGKQTTSNPPQDKAGRGPKWKALAERRLEILRTEFTLRQSEFVQGGKTTIDVLLEAHRNWAEAELVLSETKESRIAILERHVQLVQQCARKTEALFEAGRIPQQDNLQMQAALLEAQMRLAAERGE